MNALTLTAAIGFLALFSLQNKAAIGFRLLLMQRQLPLAYLILFSFFLGMLAAILLNRQLKGKLKKKLKDS